MEKILPSVRNRMENSQDGNQKMNKVLTYISTHNITKQNELIYTGAKIDCEKIVILSESTKKKSKPEWEIRLETQIRKYAKTG